MFLLVFDVLDNPFQVFCAERDNAIAALPLERFRLNFVIYVIGTAAF